MFNWQCLTDCVGAESIAASEPRLQKSGNDIDSKITTNAQYSLYSPSLAVH